MEVHLKKYAYKGLILIWLAMNLSGCATPYASSAGNYLGGFSEVQLGEDMFQVSFKGNAYTKADTVANYTLLRSAELTLQHGFTHFIVVDKADLSLSGSFTTPTSSSTTGSASIFGNTISGSSTTQFYGGQTFSFKKPGASNTIVCFNGKPQIGGVVYDAAFLVKSLKARYQISSSAISASIPSSQQSSGTSSQSVVQTSEQETGSSSNTTSTTTLTWEDGSRYVGEVLNNLPHGHGTLTIAYGGKYLGEYVGEFKDNKMHGQGTFTWANGNKYVGEYKDGEMHGQGTYTVPDGSGYVGEWKYDQPHGQGTETYADGDKYIGEYKDGEMHGQGTYTWDDGNKYVGEWKDGKRHGQGTLTWPNGRKLVGEFRDNQPWTGFLYDSNGNVLSEIQDGVKIKQE